jgi:hypothetical protein
MFNTLVKGVAVTDWAAIGVFVGVIITSIFSGIAMIIGALNHREGKSPNGTKTGKGVANTSRAVATLQKDVDDIKANLGIKKRAEDVTGTTGV